MDLLSPRKQGWVKLAQYCEVFRWPRAYAKVANFYPKGQLISNLKKWTASEQLSLVPVLHKYLCDVVAPKTDCPAAVRSCILLCRVVLMLTRIMHAGEHGITGQMLDIAVLRHLILPAQRNSSSDKIIDKLLGFFKSCLNNCASNVFQK